MKIEIDFSIYVRKTGKLQIECFEYIAFRQSRACASEKRKLSTGEMLCDPNLKPVLTL